MTSPAQLRALLATNAATAARPTGPCKPGEHMAGGTRGGRVSTIVLRRGKDGKDYPATPLTREQRNRARRLAHQLVHSDRLSIRGAQQVMAESGIRRSVGAIAADLRDYECPLCAEGT
jgi:hypothetical protein